MLAGGWSRGGEHPGYRLKYVASNRAWSPLSVRIPLGHDRFITRYLPTPSFSGKAFQLVFSLTLTVVYGGLFF